LPIDIIGVPNELSTDDAPDQDIVLENLYPKASGDERSDFYNRPQQRINLSQLKSNYERQDVYSALLNLKKRASVQIDARFTVDVDHPDISWNADDTRLDMLVCTSLSIGLDAFIPNGVDHTYQFHMHLDDQTRQLRAKHVYLGFDATNSMLWLGRSHGHEDVWLAMVTTDYENSGILANKFTGTTTAMMTKHYRMIVLMMAYMLKSIGFPGITQSKTYPDLDDDECLNKYTNVM
jgi:hypothetical protein